MTDPVTTIGLGAVAAYLGKDGLEKLLGPTADYLGEGLRDFTRKRGEAIGKIFQSAESRLGEKVNIPGEVPSKVLKVVVNEGSYASDALEVEYFGGLLASSRTQGGRDDRSARLAKMVDSLSTYQLRTHFLIYSTVRTIFSQSGLSFNMDGRSKMGVFFPINDYIEAMDFNQAELTQFQQLIPHSFFGLHADNLIEGDWQVGPKEALMKRWPKIQSTGVVCQPSALGAELFLAAHGCADKPLDYIFSADFPPGPSGVPAHIKNASSTEA